MTTLEAAAAPSERAGTLQQRRVLLALTVTLVLGLVIKSPCTSRDWSGGRAADYLCYTDIIPLYSSEGLADGRVPYVDARNEYPVLTGAWMYLFSLPVSSSGSFFLLNVAGLALLALATTVMLERLVGSRALFFAASPVLILYAFLNWDLIVVALATAALYTFLKDKPVAAGTLLGLGAAAKLYPALFLIPFAWDLWRRGRSRDGGRMLGAAAVAWLAVDLPVGLASFSGWSYFFRFSAERGVNEGSTWFLLCQPLGTCGSVAFTKVIPIAALLVGVAAVLWWGVRGGADVPRWTLALPLLIVVLLTNKVYSPQYDLWLLPLFAVVLPKRGPFWAFQAASVAVYVRTFSWIGVNLSTEDRALIALKIAVAFRALVLLAVLVVFVRSSRKVEELVPAIERS